MKVIDFVKHVATAAGVAYYHEPIGTPIVSHPHIGDVHGVADVKSKTGEVIGHVAPNSEGSTKKYSVHNLYGEKVGEANTFTGAQVTLGHEPGKPPPEPEVQEWEKELMAPPPAAPWIDPTPNLPATGEKVVLVEQLDAAPVGAKITYKGAFNSDKVYTKQPNGSWEQPSGFTAASSEFKPGITAGSVIYGDVAPKPIPGPGQQISSPEQLNQLPAGTTINFEGLSATKEESGAWDINGGKFAPNDFKTYINKGEVYVSIPPPVAEPEPPQPKTPSLPEAIKVSGKGQTEGLKLVLGKGTTKVNFHGQHLGTAHKTASGQYHAKDTQGFTISAHSSRKEAVAAIVKHHNKSASSGEYISDAELASAGKRPTKSPGHASFGVNTAPGLHPENEPANKVKRQTAETVGKDLHDNYISKLDDKQLNEVYQNFTANSYRQDPPDHLHRSSDGQLIGSSSSYDADYSRGQPGYKEALSEYMSSVLISTWADTSNDHNEMSLAVQNRAAVIFGIPEDDIAPWHWDSQSVKIYSAENENLIDHFLTAQYKATQARLKAEGIEYLDVVRGFMFSYGAGSAPEWTQYGHGSSFKIKMRPLSSWTTNKNTASGFGPTTVWTTVPREKILGMPGTGFGCLNEFEVVVIGGNTEVYRG